MEIISLLIGEISKWMDSIPVEFLLTIMLALMGYLVKRVNQIQKNFTDDIDDLRSQQACIKEESIQSTRELKAALSKLSKDLQGELEDLQMKINESYKLSLRTAIVNEGFPDEFRLEKYDEYKALKGNSFIDKYVRDNLLKEGE